MGKTNHNPDASKLITQFIAEAPEPLRKICTELRKIILKADSEIIQDWKWGPNFYKAGMICNIGYFKAGYVSLVFFNGSLMKDKKKLFQPNDSVKMKHMRFRNVDEIDEKVIIDYVKESIALNEKGDLKFEKTIVIPDDFKKAMEKAGVLEQFNKMAFTHRKEYVRSVVDSKKPETRTRRIEKNIEMIKAK